MASIAGDGFDEPPPVYRPPSPAPTYRTVDIQPSHARQAQPQAQGTARTSTGNEAAQPRSKAKGSLSPTAQLFRQSIEEPDIKKLHSQLKRGIDANMILDHETLSQPLHLAVAVPESSVTGDMFRLLLSHGADPTLANAKGYQPIHLAAGYNNAAAVEHIVKIGHANPDPKSSSGLTPLQIAAEFGHLAVLNTLISLGARIQSNTQSEPHPPTHSPPLNRSHSHSNPRPKRTTTPLYRAACNAHLNIVTALLNAGANPWVPDEHGRTLLHHASRNAWVDLVRFLLVLSDSSVALQHVARVDNVGATALHGAAKGGSVEILNLLLGFEDLKGMIDKPMRKGFTPLLIASHFNHAPAVCLLVSHGADVRLRCDDRMTALHVAVQGENDKSDPGRDLLTALIDAGVDVHAVDGGRRTAVDLALVLGKADVAVWLVQQGATISEDLKSDARLKRFWELGIRGWPSRP
ncbi:ankyrin repeat-containing domain protein [Aspergillus insuetus]